MAPDENHCCGASFDLLLDLTGDVVLICAVDGVEKVSSNELEVQSLVVAHQVEAFGLHLVAVLVADEDMPAWHATSSYWSGERVPTARQTGQRLSSATLVMIRAQQPHFHRLLRVLFGTSIVLPGWR